MSTGFSPRIAIESMNRSLERRVTSLSSDLLSFYSRFCLIVRNDDAQDFFPVHIHRVFCGLLASRVAEEIWQRFHDEISSALFFFFFSLSLSLRALCFSDDRRRFELLEIFEKISFISQVKEVRRGRGAHLTCVSRKTVRSLFQNLYI